MIAGGGVVFRLLGPVEVSVAGRMVRLPRLERDLVALLALHAGRLVPLDRIVDVLWGERPPDSVQNRIHALVSGLRRSLGEAGGLVVTEPGLGYRLGRDGYEVDAALFDRLVGKARELSAAQRQAEAADVLREASGLWRGAPLMNVAGLSAEAVRLSEARMAALRERFDLELALGRHDELTGELGALAIEHPTREPLIARLMLALYRAGRQAEALETFARARAYLIGELGVEPGAELVATHERIQRRDPGLDLAATAKPARDAIPAQLPRDVPDFTGRGDEVSELLSLVENSLTPFERSSVNSVQAQLCLGAAALETERTAAIGKIVTISAIDGMAGIGKTALAVHVAHRLRDRFPDGHLYLDLRAHTAGAEPVETVEALDFLLRSIGVPLSRIPDGVDERAALWRTELARLRVLIVLDNAAGADQVRPLLPGTGDCFVLITSRRRLAVLEGGHSLFLDLLPRADATALFIAVAGARAAAEPDAVAEVVELCGRLPLAIRVAAARMRSRPQWTVADLADRLRRQTRLNELSTGDRGVRAALDLSYQDLGTDERHLFRRLGLHPGEHFDAYCAAALAGIPLETADALLESLLDMHLLMPQTSDRYRFHDLIREYAVAVDDSSAGERRSALDRLFDYYLHTVNLTRELIEPVRRHIDTVVVHKPAVVPPLSDAPGALAWLDAERANLVAAVHHAAHHGWPVHAWQLVCDLRAFHVRRGSVEEIRAAYRAAERGARATHDVWAQAELANNLGGLILLSGRHHEAMASCRRGLELFRLIDDRYGVAGTLNNIGGVLTDLKRPEEAIEHFRQSQVFFEEIGDAYGQAAAIGNTGDCLTDLERYPEALDHFGRSLEILRGLGHRRGEASVWGMIGRAHRAMKEYDQAIAANERARAICQEIGDRHSEALRLVALGELHRDRGDPVRARDCFDEAIGISQWSAGCAAEARAHEGIGDLEAAAGDHAAAEVRWRQAMELYSELYDPKAAELAARLDALDPS